MTTIYDSRGRPIALGAQLGRGGEGAVFDVVGQPQLAAKVYHQPVHPQHAAKLAAMVRIGSDRLRNLSTWPIDALHVRPGGPIVGLAMPKLVGFRAIHRLYGPKTRLAEFPHATWPFLIHASSNLARAFAVMHEHGHVIGDVNHGNIVVSDKATVKFIDCDSFQIQDGRTMYRCDVGVSTHTPPELQGISLSTVSRSPNHDNFGLAVLIFQLLFMARHPFSGEYLGTGDMPIDRAIKEYRFAYGSAAAARQMKQPPASLPLDAASLPVASMFERAFAPAASKRTGRPSARDWVTALEDLARDVQQCGRDPSHSFPSGSLRCPWCELELRAGMHYFNSVVINVRQVEFSLAAAWSRIAAVASPGPAPTLPSAASVTVQPTPTAVASGRWRRARLGFGVIGVAVAIVTTIAIPLVGTAALATVTGAILAALLIANLGSKEPRAEANTRLTVARARWQQVQQRWHGEAGDAAFEAVLRELEGKRSQYEDLPALRQRRLTELHANRQRYQLHRFLEQHRVATASLHNIGPSRKATLQSYGIETAADVTEAAIRAIPRFGPSFTATLMTWRRGIEQRFVFDPRKTVDQRDVLGVEHDIATIKRHLEYALTGGAVRLAQVAQQTLAKRQLLRPQVESALRDVAQAEADVRAV